MSRHRNSNRDAAASLHRRTFLNLLGVGSTATLATWSGLAPGEAVAQPASPAGTQAPAAPNPATSTRLARFVLSVRYESIPAKALETAKTAVMDCLGVAVAGGTEESARLAARMVREEGGKEEATLYGQRFRASLLQAAFVNGIAAHAQDFDHSFVIGGQPTSPVIPAVFTLGDTLGASGKRVLEAYVAGFEVVAAVMVAVQNAGGASWHPNGTAGVFGAAAASAKLLGLTEAETETALSMAASMAGGVQANFGTMTKPLHVGNAARNGVMAARLAKAGFTANPLTLDARNGYFEAYYPGGKVDLRSLDTLGREYALEKYGVRFKPYPCGGLTHTSIYAAIRMRDENRITPDAIDHVDVAVPTDTAAPLVYRIPKTGLEGKFSMPYLVARALVDGKVTLESFTDQAVQNREVLALLERVEMKADPKLVSGSDGSRPAIVTIRLKSGAVHTLNQQFPKGSPQVPMTREERLDKFQSCTRSVIGAGASQKAQDSLDRLESIENVRALASLLKGA